MTPESVGSEGGRPARIARLLRTVAHLRPRQFAYRFLHRGPGRRLEFAVLGPPWRRLAGRLDAIDRVAGTASATAGQGPATSTVVNTPQRTNPFTAAPNPPALLESGGTLTVDSVTAPIDPFRWTDAAGGSRFRLYRLHAHLFLGHSESDPEQTRRFVDAAIDFLAGVTQAAGSRADDDRSGVTRSGANTDGPADLSLRTAWEPHPLSLRLISWVRWATRVAADGTDPPPERFNAAVAFQARYLSHHIEYETDGNHLIDNAVALVLAGWYLRGRLGFRPYLKGLTVFFRELPRQLLPDGSHDERSPMYHRLMLERVLDVIAVTRDFSNRDSAADGSASGVPVEAASTGNVQPGSAARYAATMLRAPAMAPDPSAPANDHFVGMAPSPSALLKYARSLGVKPDDTGPTAPVTTRAVARGPSTVARGPFRVFFDTDEIGPDHVPGHAHADTLQVLLWYNDQPIFVDTGTSTYDPGPRRDYERSTAAHNTVSINGENSSEVWGGFRVGRRARIVDLVGTENCIEKRVDSPSGETITAAHDGYRHLGVVHERTVTTTAKRVVIADRVLSIRKHVAILRLTRGLFTRSNREPRFPRVKVDATTTMPPIHNRNVDTLIVDPTIAGNVRRISARRVALGGLEVEFHGATKFDIEPCEIAAGFEKRVESVTIVVEFEQSLETVIEPAN